MSRYGRGGDDGTFWMGLGAAGLAIIAFCAGYTVRDSGYVIGAAKTNTPLPIQYPPLKTQTNAPKEVQSK
jgi:hypothetical protein